jgi:hypothetical protein
MLLPHLASRLYGTPLLLVRSKLDVKVAPLGWEKPFSGTNKAAYRSKNPQSPQNILLIDNSLKTPNYTTTWAKWANVGIVEDLSDIDTIVGAQAPYDPNSPTQNWKQVTGSQWGWYKWYHARNAQYESNGDSGAGARNWVLVGDDRLFFLFCTNAAGYGWYGRNSYCFGDIISFKAGDNYGTVLGADDAYSGMSNYWSYPGQYNGYRPSWGKPCLPIPSPLLSRRRCRQRFPAYRRTQRSDRRWSIWSSISRQRLTLTSSSVPPMWRPEMTSGCRPGCRCRRSPSSSCPRRGRSFWPIFPD